MNKQSRSNRPQLSQLGESTCKMLTFDNMVDAVGSKKGNRPLVRPCQQESPTKGRRPQLARLGESTTAMLTFKDMVESPVKEVRRPKLRLHRSMESVDTLKKPPTRRESASVPQDIFVPPVERAVHKSRSMPPLPVKPVEKEWPRVFIDVAPGFSVQLCGSEESIDAFKKDRVRQTVCTNCDSFLYCINTADMVLCPTCRSISPVEGDSADNSIFEKLGLGLTVEHVMDAENEEKYR